GTKALPYEQCSHKHEKLQKISLVLLAAEPGKLVGDHDVQLRSALDDLLALAGGDVVSNLSAVCPVVHHKQLQLRDIVHHKLLELVGKVVPCLLVRTISNVGHQGASFELSPDTRVNTLWPAPALP
ncbi:Os09g0501150, partial [Oryza sativa Japonica Group]